MAKRNLARTAIEGGRAGQCRDAERDLDESERRAWRDYCAKATLDPEVNEPCVGGGGWDIGRKAREFNDKLNPVLRWLEAQVNRPWDKVRSEIADKFDSRTLAGRHVLDHIRGFVTRLEAHVLSGWRYHSDRKFFPGELYVDAGGFLRQEPRCARR